MATHFSSVDEYINSFPKNVQEILQTLRVTIQKEIPGGEAVISYNIPAIATEGVCVIYFSAWQKHTSLYPFSSEMGKALEESSNYNTSGKGTIQFPLNQPLPLGLIRQIVGFRLKEVLAKKKKK